MPHGKVAICRTAPHRDCATRRSRGARACLFSALKTHGALRALPPLRAAHPQPTPQLFALGYILFTYVYFRKGGLDEEGAPFVFAGLDWAEAGGPTLNGGAILVGCTLLNFLGWFCTALVRSVSDSDAWRRIEAAHAMTIMPGLSSSQQP